jgi:ABC-type transport system substrate-binding protein
MRNVLLALCLAFGAALAPVPAFAQMVEESLPRDPGPLDFIQGDSYEQWIFQSLAGDALVGISPDGRLVPRLASSWKQLKDGALSFTLRGDAHFPDGSLVTAEDVLWTLQQLRQDPKASPTKRAILEGSEAGIAEGRPWLRSPKPEGRLLLELARVPIAQQGHPERGSGPFLYRKDPGAWVFTRRDHFLKPRIDSIRFRLLSDAASVHLAMEKGWLTLGAPVSRQQANPPPSHRLLVQPMDAQFVVWSRAGAGPLKLLEGWRKDAFPPRILGLNAKPSRGLWPETLGFSPRAISSEVTPPRPGTTLKLAYVAGEELIEKALLALRERARRDGYDLQLVPLEQGLLMDRFRKGDFELLGSMVVFDPHPWAVFEYLDPKGPMNVTGWHHARLAQIAKRIEQPRDSAWNELQSIWAGNPAALPLLDLQSVIWVDKRLDVQPSPLGLYLHTPGAAGWHWIK